ncbi:hypothetical protein H310_07169 [Aphanomyces invadans]|uniref:Uncharacterized protein n=1 Tax=Aphanomyces invadans TaxID=157072 RepID=A0A024U2Z4_9STRA|nr:hypothetical protein H310_07169 [Aphanomyces invadans]ETW00595.1 hypothetical protein H310_07169 [Aphanomyces invadans]|eukprot:XP_008870730.1 hypothetical protein H310_07169 [Aphanomyces invadans]
MLPTPVHSILARSRIETSAIVDAYLERIKIGRDLDLFWTRLTTTKFLLPNPYPQLLRHLREIESQTNAWEVPLATVSVVNIPPSIGEFGVVEGGVFGRSRLVARVDGCRLAHLSKHLGCPWYKQQSADGIASTTMTCLVGPAVFHGKGYLPTIHFLQLEQHVVIEGDNLERAITLFAHMIAKDAFDTQTSASSINQGVWVTIPSFKKSDKHTEKLWTLDAIQTSRVAFISAVKTAVAARVPCYVTEFRHAPPFNLGHGNGSQIKCAISYVRVHRELVMHFKPPNEVLTSFTRNPHRPLIEGVFFSEDALKAYVTKVAPPATTAVMEPYVAPILSNYSVGNYLAMAYALVHHICVNEDSFQPIAQLGKVTLGFPGQLVVLAQTSALIQEMLTLQILTPTTTQLHLKQLWNMVAQHAHNVRTFLCQNSHSSLLGIRHTLEQLATALEIPSASTSEAVVVQSAVDACRRIELLLEHAAQCVTRDVIETMRGDGGVVHPIQLVNRLAQTAAEEERTALAALTKTKLKRVAPKTDNSPIAMSQLVEPDQPTLPLHGIDVDQEVQSAVASLTYPPLIAREAVYMQYIVDTRLDEALQSALSAIILEGMPPNHFPPFIQRLRAYAIRHSMSLAQAAPPPLPLHAHPQPPPNQIRNDFADTDGTIVEVRGLFGTARCTSFFPDSVVSMAAKVQSWPTCPVQYTSPSALFTIQTWTSLYLRRFYMWLEDAPSQVDVVEHIQVTTVQPTLQLTQKAAELFSDAVLQDVLTISDHPQMAVVWFQTSHDHAFDSFSSRPTFKVDAGGIKLQRDLLRSRVENAALSKQWVQICVFHDCTLVVKTYVLHLVDHSRRRCFAPPRLRSPNASHLCFSRASAEWTTSLIDTSPECDVVDDADLLDMYDRVFQRAVRHPDEFATCEAALCVMLASPVVALNALETQGHAFAMACTTKCRLHELKGCIEAWVARIRAVVDTPATQDMLWLFSRWKRPLASALAAKDSMQTRAFVEGLTTFVLALRLSCQIDVHFSSKLPTMQSVRY